MNCGIHDTLLLILLLFFKKSIDGIEPFSDDETDSNASDDSSIFDEIFGVNDGDNFYKPSYEGPSVGGPIFPNFTTAALSIYLRLSKTSRKDFTTLLKILRHPKFSQHDLPRSFKACRLHLRKLDSLPIRTHKVPTKFVKPIEVYSYSIKDILYRAFSTPSLMSAMYFGPAIKVRKPKEFWHGTLWRQSPLFGEDTVMVEGKSTRS
jgi:hypothetical protein